MSYFQRPVEMSGDSIHVTELDRKRSADVCTSVIAVLKPSLVLFCSSFAWKTARMAELMEADLGSVIAF
jgi:hypothetical protein